MNTRVLWERLPFPWRPTMSWEDAVRWYRAQPGNEEAIRANYFDLPLRQAAERFRRSEEFQEVLRLLGEGAGRRALDFGGGAGIMSYALASHGWRVTAFEPDPSAEVGSEAIRALAHETALPIDVLARDEELSSLPAGSFDAIVARQVLHHIPPRDLDATVGRLARLLRSGCPLLVTREPVADNFYQRWRVLYGHPLHHLFKGENAFPLRRYLSAFRSSKLRVIETWGWVESVLNYYPGTEAQRLEEIRRGAEASYLGFGRLFTNSEPFLRRHAARSARRDRRPGRLHSFLLVK